jgi:ABC-2 type transport system permease protein
MEVIFDLGLFTLINVLIFGYVSLWLAGTANREGAYYLLLGMILWQIVYTNQYSVSVGCLWNVWSRNLSNMFVAPLSIGEHMAAFLVSGVIKTLLIFLLTAALSIVAFHFNVFDLGALNLTIYFVNLTMFAWTLGIIILGLIFCYGMRMQAFAWGIAFLFQPLTAAYYPVKVLPPALQAFAYALPPTYVFEAARLNWSTGVSDWNMIATAMVLNVVYLVVAIWIFSFLFKRSKESGQFARNEG